MRRASLAQRVFVALVAACALVAVIVTVAASAVYQRSFLADEHGQLAGECRTLASLLDQEDNDAQLLASLELAETRATLVEPDGSVLYDSLADASALPNHADRPEIAAALATGTGTAERASETAGYVSLYEAVRLESGEVLRLSVDRAGVAAFLQGDAWLLAALAVLIVGVSWLASRHVARTIVQPVLEIDPSAADARAPYVELEPLVSRLNESRSAILAHVDALEDAATLRREFTANVTHELKTPIASIQGAAELIREGVARPEDVRGFAGRIYDDAARLALLVNDILTLSKLDESERGGHRDLFGPGETVDLLSLARDVAARLEPRAEEAGVSVIVEGTPQRVEGNARLLDELVGNLMENAIRYNHPGGTVRVRVVRAGERPQVVVIDTGIGIPEEAQPKVFERFFRVDKGRSRAMGGTGLGLAIVKHAAAFHGADVHLESAVGEGTTVTVTFPAP